MPKLPTNAAAQRKRLLKALKRAKGQGITSHQARQNLDIYYPPARIRELRHMGFPIVTLWTILETDTSNPRRIARYVLLSSRRKPRA